MTSRDNDIIGAAKREFRRTSIPIITGVAILFTLFFLIGGAIIGIMWRFSDSAKPPTMMDSRIPLNSYAAATVEVLDCIDRGSVACSSYDRAKQYMISSSSGEGLLYTPLTAADPGAMEAGGLKRVTLTAQTSDADWKAVARAGTRGGLATPSTVNESTAVVDPGGQTAHFTVTDPKTKKVTTCEMTFKLNQETVAVRKITYK